MSGFVMCGRRHQDIKILLKELEIEYNKDTIIEGFLTSSNHFVDRSEAFQIAIKSGQVSKQFGTKLTSECLY